MIDRLNAALEGRYRIERELGEGGMATVWLARDLRHDRSVAIKVLRPELAAVVGADRFLAEIKTTANLHHPHILSLHDSGEADGFLYYVMPYVEGESLRDRLDREKQLPVDEAVAMAVKVAGALEAAHRQGVIHRDVKPANILLTNGEPLVADFGIALAVQQAGGGRLTETGLSLGTPYYMSPEQATADRDPDARSDVYSLGCVLYEMLVGEPPFQGSTAQAVLGRILTAEVERPTERRRSIPPHVDAVVLTALEKLPADRFGSAAELAEALSDPTRAAARTRGSGGHLRRAGALSSAAPFLGALTLLLGALAAWGWLRPLPEERISRYTVELPAERTLSTNRWFSVDMLPDGSGLVYAGESAERSGLWLKPLDALDAVFVDGSEGGLNPSVSPDGSQIAFVSPSGGVRALRVVATAGGGAFTVTDSLVDYGGVGWGHDGYIYYDGHLEGDGIARVPERGGDPEVVTTTDFQAGELWHMDPDPLPGGRGVLFSIARGNVMTGRAFQVGVVGNAGGAHRVLVDEGHSPRYAAGHLLFVREGRMMAIPFDPDRLEVSGRAAPVLHGVEVRSLGRSDLSVSRDGTLAYVAGDTSTAGAELVWMDRTGAVEHVDSAFHGVFGSIALSSDGRTAAVALLEEGAFQIWTKDLSGGGARKLTFEGANYSPAWTPDGREILFVSQGAESLDAGLQRVPADGRSLPEVVLEAETRTLLWTPSFAPSGDTIVYSRSSARSPEGRDLVARPTGPDPEEIPLLTGPAFYGEGRVSPDGRWLAYVSNETGRSEVYVRPFPDVERANALVSRIGGRFPRWSADGSELFYVTPAQDVMSARVVPGESFVTEAPVRLFSRVELGMTEDLFFEVHPDGERFLMIGLSEREDAESRVVVVENFLRELREGTIR